MPEPVIVTDVPRLPVRPRAMHKGEAGKLFCIAGSVGMVGAAALCSRAAMRAGAGLVRVGMPWRLAAVVAGRDPNVMTTALPETEDGTLSAMSPAKILKALEGFHGVVIGPGLSTNPQTVQALRTLLPEVSQRMVLDADALNAIALDDCEGLHDLHREQGLPILTPHPGEMARLLGNPEAAPSLREDTKTRAATAFEFARKFKVLLVLKGPGTVVTDGERLYVNGTGNPGMATAGMGDVLAGVIGALRCQNFDPFDAAVLGVYLHGLAGDISCAKMGPFGMLATDVIEDLPAAFKQHAEAQG